MKTSNWKLSFFSIWTGQALSLLGSRVAQFALIWWLTEKTGSATVLAMASLVAFIPEIVLGPLAGAYVDRWNRRVVMIVADGLIALASLWLAIVFWQGAIQVWHVYLIMAIRSIGGSFHWPAMQASTSLLVPRNWLTRIAGLNQSLYGALGVVGAPAGALLMAWLPLHGVMLVDVGTALVAILPLFFVRIPQPERAAQGAQQSIWGDVRDGFRYIWAWPGLVGLIALALVIKIALTPAFSLLPLLVNQHFGGDAVQLSALDAMWGLGAVVGGLVLGAWGGFRRKVFTIMGGLVVMGVGLLVLGMLPPTGFFMALVAMLFVGFSLPFIDGSIMAIMQGTVAPEVQGRVFMTMASLLSLTSPLSLIAAGPVADAIGLQIWYIAAGLLCGVAAIAGAMIPAIVHIEENAGGNSEENKPIGEVVA